MRHTNARTSLRITLLPEGGANIEQHWSDFAIEKENRPIQASESIIAELIKVPDYKWLENIVRPYLAEKYCSKCSIKNCAATQVPLPIFPYCFKENTTEK